MFIDQYCHYCHKTDLISYATENDVLKKLHLPGVLKSFISKKLRKANIWIFSDVIIVIWFLTFFPQKIFLKLHSTCNGR